MPKPTRVPGLGPETRLGTAARRLVAARLADVRKHEPTVRRGPEEETVHDMRVATRRLRAAVDLFAAQEDDALDDAMKSLQDALGGVRDLQLQLRWLDETGLEGAGATAIGDETRRTLEERAHSLATALVVWEEKTAPLLQSHAKSSDGKRRLGGGSMRRTLDRFAKRAEKALRRLGKTIDPERAHELRIRLKKLRYAAELLAAAFPMATERIIEQLPKLQEELGALHDLDARIIVLRRYERTLEAAGRRAARELENRLRQEREKQAKKVRRALARWRKKDFIGELREKL